jgi:propanol-preferring alcohol dehydrogenase
MKAAVVRSFGDALVIEDRPVPIPGPLDVVVRVEACGLCQTDLSAALGTWPAQPELPFVPGHEIVGRVTAVGSDVHHVGLGERVAVPWLGWACGHCDYCLTGRESLCGLRRNTGSDIDGGFADYVRASADFVVGVPRGIDVLDAACLTCAGASAYRAVMQSGAGISDLTAVFGIGGVGHLALQYAAIAGATVVAVDTVAGKLTMASALGARHVVDASAGDPVLAVQALGGADQAIVATGAAHATEQALASLRPGGTLVLLAMPTDQDLQLPVFETVKRGITVIGSIGANRMDLVHALALHRDGRTRVVHQARTLAHINEAMAELEADEVPARLVFEFR